jgi:hypothetical protein
MKDFSQSLVAVSVFASNILFLTESGYFATSAELKPLLHTWSLAVEEQYYLLFPLFLMLFWKLGTRWILVALGIVLTASLAVAQWAAYNYPTAAFYLLPTRGWELLIGAFAALYLSDVNRKKFCKSAEEVGGWLGLGLILFAVFAYTKATPFPGLYALVPTLGAVLIILFATKQTTVGKFVGNKMFAGIGLISYSAYLWHQPLFAFARHGSLTEPSYTVFLMLSVFALLLAYLSWSLVEKPFRSQSYIGRRNIFILSFWATSGFLIFGLCGHFYDGFKNRFGIEYDRFIFAQNDVNPRKSECHFSGDVFPSPQKYCILGEGKVSGLLLGDSHADAIAHSLSNELSKSHIALKSITYSGCPPVENVYRVDQKNQHKCYEVNKQSFDYALANPAIEYVVMLGRWSMYIEGSYFNNLEGGVESGDFNALDTIVNGVKQRHPEKLRIAKLSQYYKATVERLLEGGKKVILIYPIPEVGFHVPNRLARLKMFGSNEEVTTSYDVFLERNRRVLSTFDSLGDNENLIRIRPDKVFCETKKGGRCLTVKEGNILYYDDDHLSNTGSSIIAKDVVNTILKR